MNKPVIIDAGESTVSPPDWFCNIKPGDVILDREGDAHQAVKKDDRLFFQPAGRNALFSSSFLLEGLTPLTPLTIGGIPAVKATAYFHILDREGEPWAEATDLLDALHYSQQEPGATIKEKASIRPIVIFHD